MTNARQQALTSSIVSARLYIRQARYEAAMRDLERAHVLGQDYVGPHALVHWLMLRVALRRGQLRAALGQLVRIALGTLGSATGHLPRGNSGSSDVSMFEPQAIPVELLQLIQEGRHD